MEYSICQLLGIAGVIAGAFFSALAIIIIVDYNTPRWLKLFAVVYVLGFVLFLGVADDTIDTIGDCKGVDNVIYDCANTIGDCAYY